MAPREAAWPSHTQKRVLGHKPAAQPAVPFDIRRHQRHRSCQGNHPRIFLLHRGRSKKGDYVIIIQESEVPGLYVTSCQRHSRMS